MRRLQASAVVAAGMGVASFAYGMLMRYAGHPHPGWSGGERSLAKTPAHSVAPRSLRADAAPAASGPRERRSRRDGPKKGISCVAQTYAIDRNLVSSLRHIDANPIAAIARQGLINPDIPAPRLQ